MICKLYEERELKIKTLPTEYKLNPKSQIHKENLVWDQIYIRKKANGSYTTCVTIDIISILGQQDTLMCPQPELVKSSC